MKWGRGTAGYSLIEVLIAFAVMALVLGTLVPGQTLLAEAATRPEERLLMQDYARSLIEIARLQDDPLGGIPAGYRGWKVEADFTDEEIEGATLRTMIVRLIPGPGRSGQEERGVWVVRNR